jgi:hypothetical protein
LIRADYYNYTGHAGIFQYKKGEGCTLAPTAGTWSYQEYSGETLGKMKKTKPR